MRDYVLFSISVFYISEFHLLPSSDETVTLSNMGYYYYYYYMFVA